MITLLFCCVLCVNALYAATGAAAAKRYGVDANIGGGVGLGVLTGVTAVEMWTLAHHANTAPAAVFVLAFGAIAASAAFDAVCGYVFDAITLPCLAAMVVLAALSQCLMTFAGGAAAAGGSLALLYAITRGRGLGFGDVKLACCIGGCAGAIGGLAALGIAFVLGGIWAAFLLVTKQRHRGDELRFAPYMAAGVAIVTLYGALS